MCITDANLLEGLALSKFLGQVVKPLCAVILAVIDELLRCSDERALNQVLICIWEAIVLKFVPDEALGNLKVLVISSQTSQMDHQLINILAHDPPLFLLEYACHIF